MSKRSDYAEALATLPVAEWPEFLASTSGLPGPRANLELARAFADVADAETIEHFAASGDEYRALCGTIGLGRLLADGADGIEAKLRAMADDERWRVREGVAMALQRLGDHDIRSLVKLVLGWADGSPLVQRAAIAGLCEPRFLNHSAARSALDLLDRVTGSLAAAPKERRRDENLRVLRQALGYCWSVAAAAAPDDGFYRLERWAGSGDADVVWIIRENLKKNRMTRADPARAAALSTALNH